MADGVAQIIITAVDQTQAGVSSAKSSVAGVGAAASQASGGMRSMGKAADESLSSIAKRANLSKNEILQLNYTLSDVVASLASGASPMTILLQQGGQVKDAFGGIGPMFSKIGGALGPVGLAAGALAVTLGGLGFVWYRNNEAAAEFARTLQVTGNYAGMTDERLRSMSESLALASGTTRGESGDVIRQAAGTGRLDSRELQAASQAALNLERLTGQSTEKTIANFAAMKDGVADAAASMNKSFHFLSLEQFAQAKELEDSGRKHEAFMVVMDALNKKLAEQKETVGAVSGAWRDMKHWMSDFWTNWGFADIGAIETPLRKLEAAQKQLKSFEVGLKLKERTSGADVSASDRAELQRLQKVVSDAQADLQAQRKQADDQSAAAAKAEGQIAAKSYIDGIDKKAKSYRSLSEALAEYRRNVDQLKGTKEEVSGRDQALHEAAIRKQYERPEAAKQQSAFERERDKLGSEAFSVQSQIAAWEKYGDTVDHARRAEVEFLLQKGKLVGVSKTQAAELIKLADNSDAYSRKLAGMKDVATLDKKVKAIQAEAGAYDLSARASQEAVLMAELEGMKARISAKDYEDLAAAIKKAVNARADRNLTKMLEEQKAATDESIDALREEAKLFGKGELERKQAEAARALEAKRKKALRDDPAGAEKINKEFDDMAGRQAKAIAENYAAQRTFDAGWKQAFSDYAKNATNAAEAARTVFQSVTSGMEDMMVSLITTGKADLKAFMSSMAADLARIGTRMAMTKAMSYFASADGNAFSGGVPVKAFAAGGAFTNGVVSSPTTAPMALFGEAGPEAIMPLQRTPSGKLGVVAQGGGSITVAPSISITVQGGADENQSRRQGESISRQVSEQVRAIVVQTIADQRRARGAFA